MNTHLSKIDKSRQRLNELSRRQAFSHYIKHGNVPRVWNEIMDASHTEEKFLRYLTRYHQAVSHKANVGAEEQSTTHYIWRTKRDGRVRSEHAANDGKLFSWKERPVTGHPGEKYNCRFNGEVKM
ncbi:phage minor head protein [Ochrobactrum sp. Marseille-Q0166]|uniref:phage minor head protein n=1 Tax=Ochrobactrum sp. Marseille-Q0166 TaxID=2761105 RepID=UPI001655B09C|nr:phage minor head protein [Ochrobactrum sp. Marseille-Q0166]MBC8717954.1 minor capsid protein [Ochrobactrum sp. Marseille-Q0166]